ncbi:hypothetical protein ES703_97949 [subsurface metagenome]
MILRRPYIIRRATSISGKEVTVPGDCPLEPGDKVVVLSDGFMVVVPEGSEVDEGLLKRSIKLRGK